MLAHLVKWLRRFAWKALFENYVYCRYPNNTYWIQFLHVKIEFQISTILDLHQPTLYWWSFLTWSSLSLTIATWEHILDIFSLEARMMHYTPCRWKRGNQLALAFTRAHKGWWLHACAESWISCLQHSSNFHQLMHQMHACNCTITYQVL